MKRIILSTLVASSLLMAANEAEIKQEISDVEAQIKALNANLKKLKSTLPKKVAKKDSAQSEFVTHTELGYISTSGNTNTDTFNLDTKVKKNWGPHVFTFSLLKQYGTENEIETKNKLLTELEYDYDFTDRLSFGYLVGYKDDKFSGYDYQFYTGPGVKYKAVKTDKHLLSLEGNILYAIDAIEDTALKNGNTKSYASYRTKVVYDWQILDNLKFNQELSYRSEFSNTKNYFIYSKTLLSSKISDIFSAGISQQIDYMNQPADGKTGTDRTFTFNLIADY
ncbi:MAG: DUF481 domain-containing protein [Sulfurimonas sp.]|nr:DUF481 domain-containing protein [Sulfurimonas sp.]